MMWMIVLLKERQKIIATKKQYKKPNASMQQPPLQPDHPSNEPVDVVVAVRTT